MPARTLRRAFSLAEVVVASGLFAVITLVLASLLTTELRFCTRAANRLSVEREQMLLDESLRQDIMATASAGISLEPSGKGLALQPVEDVAPDGFLLYSTTRLVVYRYEADLLLHRYAWQVRPLAVALSNRAQRLTRADWTNLLSQRPDRDQHWSNLKSFQVTCEARPSDVTQRITFDMTWQEEKATRATRACFFTRQNP